MKKWCIFILSLALLAAQAFGRTDKEAETEKKSKINEEQLVSLPVAQNPWSIINLVPGMMLDREDVGGSESGMQSSFYGFGAAGENTTWQIDGIRITAPATLGMAPAYLDSSAFAGVQVTVGGHDMTAQTGGTQVNFVSRRGGNRLRGGVYFYFEDDGLEKSHDLPASITDRGWGSPGISSLYQYGLNLSGPIIKNKLWFSGSYGIRDVTARTLDQREDATWLGGLYEKIDFRFGGTSGSLFYTGNRRKKSDVTWLPPGRQDENTTWDLTDPFAMFRAGLQQEIGRLLLSVNFAYTRGGVSLEPNGAVINPQTGHLEGADMFHNLTQSAYFSGSLPYHSEDWDAFTLSLDGNYFLEKFVGGDHEIRFGVDFYTSDTTSQTLYPNQRRLYIFGDKEDANSYKEIRWITDAISDVSFKRVSFYLSDTVSFGRLTAHAGLRFDKETGYLNAVHYPGLTLNGQPVFTDYLGELQTADREIDAAFNVFSPRFSLTYDLRGNGRDILTASFARYGSYSGNSFARFQDPRGSREIDVRWHDVDGDLEPDVGEFSEAPEDWVWWNVDPFQPYALSPPDLIDPGYNSPLLTEIILAYEKKLTEDLQISLTAFYKKNTNLNWDRGYFVFMQSGSHEFEEKNNWYKAGDYIFRDGSSKPWYERYEIPNATYRTNHGSGTYNVYKALQLVFSKKLSHGWMLDASFVLSDWKQYLDSEEFFDKTNFDYFDGGAYAPESGLYDYADFEFYHSGLGPYSRGTGLAGVYVNSRWQFKVSGMAQLPYGFNLSGVFQAREGYIITYYEQPWRGSGLGRTPLYEPGKKFGDDRLPAFWILNLGLEKSFKLSSYLIGTLFVNGYNITNNSITLQVDPVLGFVSAGQPTRILNPAIYQLGVRLDF